MESAEHGTTLADATIAPDLGKALLLAQQVADETLAEARREAAQIVADARREAAGTDDALPSSDLKHLLDTCMELEQSLTKELEGAARQLYSLRVRTGERMTELQTIIERLDRGRG